MSATGPEVFARYDKWEKKRIPHEAKWEIMAPHLSPSRVGVGMAGTTPGQDQTRGVFDSTMMYAAELFANFISSYLFSPASRWLSYKMSSFRRSDEIQEWMEECTDRTLSRFGASSFYAEASESLVDWGGFGTGWLIGEESPQPINRTIRGFRGFAWKAAKTGRFVIAEGIDGRVDSGGREFMMTAEKINERWGPNNRDRKAPLPENIQHALNQGETQKTFKIIHAIYPRSKFDKGYGNLGMPWTSCWIERESKHLLQESGYAICPFAAPRYQQTPGEDYGRGRGDLAWPDNFSLNAAKRLGLEDWALKIRPPLFHQSDTITGSLRLIPGAPTSVVTHGRDIRQVIMPMDTGSRPEVSSIKEEELRKSIRQIFFVDQILQLLEVHKSEMKAFEFAKKIELVFKLIGPVYGRASWELLYQVADIAFVTQFEAGAFSPPPQAVFDTDGDVSIEFDNPIARAQKAGDIEALVLGVQDLAPLATLYPEVYDRIDPLKTADGVWERRGVQASFLRNDDEMERFQDARAQKQQKEESLDEAGQIAEASGKAAPMLKVLQGGQGA